MRTDDLIRALAHDATPAAVPSPRLDLALVLGCAVAMGIGFLMLAGPRSDLSAHVAAVTAKVVLTLLTATAGLALVLRLARPGVEPGRSPALLGLVVALLAAWTAGTWLMTPAALTAGLFSRNAWHCLVAIPVLALPTLALLVAVARRGAVTRPTLAGWAAGLAAAGLSATFYALSCTEDSPLFVAIWYGLATLAVGAVGAAAFRRFVRW